MLGAEAEVIRGNYNECECAIKRRIPKTYRHAQIDKTISNYRLSNEVKILKRLFNFGLDVPKIYNVAKESHTIYMEWIYGIMCKEFLENSDKSVNLEFAILLANVIAKMHLHNVIHGDLTTCNIICRKLSDCSDLPLDKRVSPCIIDFGLSYNSTSIEDKAVDLHVLEKCIACSLDDYSTEWFDAFLNQYSKIFDKGSYVVKRLEQVRRRGRKMPMIG